MHYKKLLKAHAIFYGGEYKQQDYDEYMRNKDWLSWRNPVLPDVEVTKLWNFILSWDFHFKGNRGKFKAIYREIYPVIQRLEEERIEDINFDDKLKRDIQEIFDKVARCPQQDRYECTDASKILHTILPNLFVMWDDRIRLTLLGKVMCDGKDYALKFLPLMQKDLNEAISNCMEEKRLSREEAIKKISECSGNKSLPKLLDEFNYVRYTLNENLDVQVQLYDTTLRDGAQQEGISFSVEDKLKIAQKLDELGIEFIEGGWPGSNPKDTEFFAKAQNLNLTYSTLVAFGSTRRSGCKAEEDANIKALLEAKTKVVTIVGKAWDKQVTQVLETSLEENLGMVTDSISYLKSKGLRVFFDAEHFFDGYKGNPEYALEVVTSAARAGAECLVLCDTNGGTLPQQITRAIKAVRDCFASLAMTPVPLGIHAHNDAELAVANSLAAVEAGVTQVQGTINGYGERCGNANLCSIIPTLKLKMGIDCVTVKQLSKLSDISRYVSELANLPHYEWLPYVGSSAFTHKGGIHVSGLIKWEESYQHIDPEVVGNRPRVVISELAGKGSIIYKAKERGLPIPKGGEIEKVLIQIKSLENQGFQYDSAEASFDLLLHRAQPDYQPPFELVDFMVVVEKRRRPPSGGNQEEPLSEATIKVKVDERIVHTAAEGNGPVNALDQALRKALIQFYPDLTAVTLTDYKVRILEETAGTASQVRVLIESSDGQEHWRTVGSSTNIIEASWLALADSIEYWLIKQRRNRN